MADRSVARLACEFDALLGEGPVWCDAEQRLHFVDIKRGKILSLEPRTGKLTQSDVAGTPSFVFPANDGTMVFGDGSTLVRLANGERGQEICRIEQPSSNRLNDGCVDCHGRLWFGTMDNHEAKPLGRFWCYDRGITTPSEVTAIVTNGPAVSADGTTLYTVDSIGRRIDRHLITNDGKLTYDGVFLQLPEQDGYPDGITLDASGNLWVALWDGWAVRRYSPAGVLEREVRLPCARVTKLALGGPEYTTAYVTTARIGLSDDDLKAQPLAGSVFAFEAGSPGLPTPRVALREQAIS